MTTKEKLKSMTSEEFLSYCMNYSKYGVICQLVMMEVIERGLRDILIDKKTHLKRAKDDEEKGIFHLVDVPSFIGAAEELRERFDLKYK